MPNRFFPLSKEGDANINIHTIKFVSEINIVPQINPKAVKLTYTNLFLLRFVSSHGCAINRITLYPR